MQELDVPRLTAPPVSGGLSDSVFTTAEQAPGRVQFSLSTPGQEWEPVTAHRFAAEVLAVARGLVAQGVGFGDRVAVMSRTRYEWTLAAYALWSVGAVVVPIYPTSSTEQVRGILRDTGAIGCFVENENLAMTVAAAHGPHNPLTRLWQMDQGDLDVLKTEGAEVDASYVHRLRAGVRPEDTALICYTSGTTGRPKGCVLTHANMIAECDTLSIGWGSLLAAPGEEPSLVAFLPLAHCYGLVVVISSVRFGVNVAFQPDPSPHVLLPTLAAFRPTFLYAVPYIFERLFRAARLKARQGGRSALFERAVKSAVRYAEAEQRRKAGRGSGPGPRLRLRHAVYDRLVYARVRAVLGGRVRNAVSGGSPLSRELGLFLAGCGITVYDGYGLTETAAAVTAQPVGAVRHGTVGRPLPGNAVRIAGDGEIQVRGDVIFAGYHNDPESTDAVLRDGWFSTGDLGHLDPDGYLVITGRKKDIIITSGGKSISPLTLEEELRGHPLISGCLVVGDNRPYVAALITLDEEAVAGWLALKGREPEKPAALVTDEELLGHVRRAVTRANSRVSRAESIRAFKVLPHEFGAHEGLLTPSLKVRRSAAIQRYAREIDELYGTRPPRRSR
ncbi:long-chain fatty acid--CoA ligase [Streptomyces sp. VRA16 Mangrove soil]|uniref:AMP-dependent synthetase/ligase n=1 Tax=Streptomyces sp. VRA16 Mangrove soil TaxID=2817434 RepID=UPI001A9DBF47|nr:AMP-dependent synthetase/ligase [Streptomyces sp. VRA16 Mangrove soil]MBO1333010.1 long-chain fatty acid--CoA ligase [Streptomyces sp. VRA16 Mangrove soil]